MVSSNPLTVNTLRQMTLGLPGTLPRTRPETDALGCRGDKAMKTRTGARAAEVFLRLAAGVLVGLAGANPSFFTAFVDATHSAVQFCPVDQETYGYKYILMPLRV